MLEFGRELLQLSHRLEQDSGINETNQKMLEVSKLVVQFVRQLLFNSLCKIIGRI